MRTATDGYVEFIKNGNSPQADIVKCFLGELKEKSSQTKFDDISYTVGAKHLQYVLREGGIDASKSIIGRTIKAFFDCAGLEEGKDYTLLSKHGSGTGKRYLLELNKNRIRKLTKQFR
jgi:hypothetical protein